MQKTFFRSIFPVLLMFLFMPSIRAQESAAPAEEAVAAEEPAAAEAVPAEPVPADPAVEPAAAEAAPLEGEFDLRLDVRQIMDSGGFLIYVLLVMSVAAFALILYFFFALNGNRVTPTVFLRDVEVMLGQSRFEEARNACLKNGSPAAQIVLSAVNYVDRMEETDPDLLRQVVEGEGIRQAGRLQSQITYLLDIGVIAPMVGLLGTVMGMLTSFSAVALDIHRARPVELANGVSTALVTTAAGLIVAIPAMMFYSFFRGRLAKLTGGMELAATNVVTQLAHRKPRD